MPSGIESLRGSTINNAAVGLSKREVLYILLPLSLSPPCYDVVSYDLRSKSCLSPFPSPPCNSWPPVQIHSLKNSAGKQRR